MGKVHSFLIDDEVAVRLNSHSYEIREGSTFPFTYITFIT
jgi:hypothetical protein